MAVKLTFEVKFLAYNPINNTYDYGVRGRLFDGQTGEGIDTSQIIETYYRRAPPDTPLPEEWTKAGATYALPDGTFTVSPSGILGFDASMKGWINIWIAYNPTYNVWSPEAAFVIGEGTPDWWYEFRLKFRQLPIWQKTLLLAGSFTAVGAVIYKTTKKR